MREPKLVVIGGDAAGMSAASKVRRTHPEREIVVFEQGEHTSYAACGMPYYIAGEIEGHEKLIARKPEVFREKQNIDVRIQHRVEAIDTNAKTVSVTNLKTGESFDEKWDQLLIATGAAPVRPPITGLKGAKGVFSLSILQTGIDVFTDIETHHPKTAVVVGGGYIGIEMAEALLARGLKVTLIDMAPQVMTTMDSELAEKISSYMKDEGINVMLKEKLSEIECGDNGRVKAVVTEKHRLEADIVILGLGVKPRSELAEMAGIKLGDSGAIAVNSKLETSAVGVWAAGDCAESFHRVSGEQVHIALGTIANKHGAIAGTNISGGDAKFPGVLGTAITKFNRLEIARTGLSEKEAKKLKVAYETATTSSRTRSGYYPGSAEITVKLLVRKASGELLGGQIIGFEGSGKRIDTIAAAITGGLTANDLTYADLSYAPPFSPVWDPVQICARKLV
ncbi:MAG: FAD-dependent oxidoreductase [Balneolia bacterium]|nr:FAD-dependent oxidoreductase [Balneolia bacterium]